MGRRRTKVTKPSTKRPRDSESEVDEPLAKCAKTGQVPSFEEYLRFAQNWQENHDRDSLHSARVSWDRHTENWTNTLRGQQANSPNTSQVADFVSEPEVEVCNVSKTSTSTQTLFDNLSQGSLTGAPIMTIPHNTGNINFGLLSLQDYADGEKRFTPRNQAGDKFKVEKSAQCDFYQQASSFLNTSSRCRNSQESDTSPRTKKLATETQQSDNNGNVQPSLWQKHRWHSASLSPTRARQINFDQDQSDCIEVSFDEESKESDSCTDLSPRKCNVCSSTRNCTDCSKDGFRCSFCAKSCPCELCARDVKRSIERLLPDRRVNTRSTFTSQDETPKNYSARCSKPPSEQVQSDTRPHTKRAVQSPKNTKSAQSGSKLAKNQCAVCSSRKKCGSCEYSGRRCCFCAKSCKCRLCNSEKGEPTRQDPSKSIAVKLCICERPVMTQLPGCSTKSSSLIWCSDCRQNVCLKCGHPICCPHKNKDDIQMT